MKENTQIIRKSEIESNYFVAKAMSLAVISSILLSLNSRMTTLLKNLLDADSKKKVMETMLEIEKESHEASVDLVDTVKSLTEVMENSMRNDSEISNKSTNMDKSKDEFEKIKENILKSCNLLNGLNKKSEEIRSLTERTKDAVGSVSGIVDQVVFNTVMTADDMSRKIVEMETLTADVAKYLAEIVELVSSVKEISSDNMAVLKDVVETSEHGKRDMEKLSGLVVSINEMSNRLSDI